MQARRVRGDQRVGFPAKLEPAVASEARTVLGGQHCVVRVEDVRERRECGQAVGVANVRHSHAASGAVIVAPCVQKELGGGGSRGG